MSILLGELQASEAILSRLTNLSLPIKLAYKVNKLVKLVQPEIDFYYQTLKTIIDDCAEHDAEGKCIVTGPQSVKIKEDLLEECQRRINELAEITVAADLTTFSEEDLDLLTQAGLTLTAIEMENFIIYMK